ncbi:MAG: ThiF family adenylyltransferase [Candidatus Methanomethylophilaceae archaeon]|nr:ThiF family adenylyltransferase [Candidatus Methanomethylophilaceae archaeon]
MTNNDYFARQRMMISKAGAKLIKGIRILIFGLGAGGNEVLKNLVLMGFRRFTVCDFDTVEDSNLSKSVFFRREDIGKGKAEVAAKGAREMALAEDTDIRFINGNLMTDLGKGVFLEHDIVIICVDTQKARAYINDMCVLTKTPFFEVGFRGYNAEVSFFAPVGPMQQEDGTVIDKLPTSDGKFPKMLGEFPVCLREEIGIGSFDEKRNSCSGFKVKDKELAKIPTIQVSAALTGALVAQEVVKYLEGKDTMRNKMLLFFGLTLQTMLIEYSRRDDCTIHDKKLNLVTVPVPRDVTIGQALRSIESRLGSQAFLSLPDDFILSVTCHSCGEKIQINARSKDVWDDQRWCAHCRETYPDYESRLIYPGQIEKIPREVSLNNSRDILDRRMADVGVPENDILECTIRSAGEIEYYDVYLKTEE